MMHTDWKHLRRQTEAEAVQRSWAFFWRDNAALARKAGNTVLADHYRSRAMTAERRASEIRGQVLASR